jgi:hypothetical protein
MITYEGRPRAFCTARRVFMTDDDPIDCDDGRFVLAMCIYAGAVLNGELPGPYRESAARAFARVSLIPVRCSGCVSRSRSGPTCVRRWAFRSARFDSRVAVVAAVAAV